MTRPLAFTLPVLLLALWTTTPSAANHWQQIKSGGVTVGINEDLTLTVYQVADAP